MKKFIFLGASRGLGWHTYKELLLTNEVKSLNEANSSFEANSSNAVNKAKDQYQFLLSSRKIKQIEDKVTSQTTLVPQDFSTGTVDSNFYDELSAFNGDCLVYFAGGGPYGLFQQKKWNDHMWSLNTTFLYPAQLLHRIYSDPKSWPNLKKIIMVGSSIAEQAPDPMASSYCAAKHALKGLVETIQNEQKLTPELVLFSPGYMQTDLLPMNSHPRLNHRAEHPEVVAKRLIEYILS